MFPGLIRVGNDEREPEPAILSVPGSFFRDLLVKQIASLRVFIAGIESGAIPPDEDGDPKLEQYRMTLDTLVPLVDFIADGPHVMTLDEYRTAARKLSEYLSPDEYLREQAKREGKKKPRGQITPEEISRLAGTLASAGG